MSVKINGHTIASKLRKMFSSNGQTVAANLDGEIPSGGGSALVVNVTCRANDNGVTLDKTWKEIHDAIASGTPVYMKGTFVLEYETVEYFWLICGTYAQSDPNLYGVNFSIDTTSGGPLGVPYFHTNSENGYPEYIPD